MLPPMTLNCVDGSATNLQALRYRAPLVIAFLHGPRCPDCRPALEVTAAARELFPELRVFLVAPTWEPLDLAWPDCITVEPDRIARHLWDRPPEPPVLVLADRYAAVRRSKNPPHFGELPGAVQLLEHECPERGLPEGLGSAPEEE